jgi:hypothetical protein
LLNRRFHLQKSKTYFQLVLQQYARKTQHIPPISLSIINLLEGVHKKLCVLFLYSSKIPNKEEKKYSKRMSRKSLTAQTNHTTFL